MFANIGPWQLLIILVIVLAIFGTKRLRTLGSDLGSAVKGFRSAMNEAEESSEKLGDSPAIHPATRTSTTRRLKSPAKKKTPDTPLPCRESAVRNFCSCA